MPYSGIKVWFLGIAVSWVFVRLGEPAHPGFDGQRAWPPGARGTEYFDCRGGNRTDEAIQCDWASGRFLSDGCAMVDG